MKLSVDETILIQTKYGMAEAISFSGLTDGKEHIVFAFGNWRDQPAPTVRIHSECLTGDVFGSKRCDCGLQLEEAMQTFSTSSGLVIYLRQEGRGIGLYNKLRAYRLQDDGLDTYEANIQLGFAADLRDFAIAADILNALSVREVRLLSNNPEKARQLAKEGIIVRDRLFTRINISAENINYLYTKAHRGGHDGLRSITLKEAFS